MHFQDVFVTHAGQVGLLAVLTEFILVVTAFSFFAMTIFSLATNGSTAPEHRTSGVLTAVICFVAGASYLVIRTYFHAMLESLAKLPPNSAERHDLLYTSYFAIGQYRYMDWTVTTRFCCSRTCCCSRLNLHRFPVSWARC